MYLVINLAVADMFAGGFSAVTDFIWVGNDCNFWQYNVPYGGIWDYVISDMNLFFPVMCLTNVFSVQASRHQKMDLWSNYYSRLGHSRELITTAGTVWWFNTAEYTDISKISYTWPASIFICLLVIFVSYASIAVKIRCGAHPRHHGGAS